MVENAVERSGLIDWLLESPTPSIRYLTLRDLLGRPEAADEVQAVRDEMQVSGPIPAVLAGQRDDGHWAVDRSYYTPKYVSTHWSMLLLVELAADPSTHGLQRGADFMLADTADELQRALEKGAHGLSCFWGNLLRYSLHAGRADDPRLQPMVDTLCRDATQHSWRCPYNEERPCAWGAARTLWGLAALPPRLRAGPVVEAVESGLALLLAPGDLLQGYPALGKAHTLWQRLNFPLFYQADVLFVLRVAAELGALDRPGARTALDWLAARRRPDGRRRGSSPYRQRTWPALADPEDIDRWVSLQALWVLQRAG